MNNVQCLTFSETLQFCSPASCNECASDSRVRCANCTTNSKKYCFTKTYSRKTGKQTALTVTRRNGKCRCPYQKSRSHRCH